MEERERGFIILGVTEREIGKCRGAGRVCKTTDMVV